ETPERESQPRRSPRTGSACAAPSPRRCDAGRADLPRLRRPPCRRAQAGPLPDDAAFGFGEEIQDLAHRRAILGLGLERAARLLEAQSAPVERAIRLLQPVDRLRRETAALQALAVDSVRPRHVARGGDE